MDTPGEVLEVEDLPVDEREVVGVSLRVRDHPDVVEAAKIEMEVQRGVAATRTESLRMWAHGLLEGRLERGVPDAPQVQAWKGKTLQGAHLIDINLVGLRTEAVGAIRWRGMQWIGGVPRGRLHSGELNLAG